MAFTGSDGLHQLKIESAGRKRTELPVAISFEADRFELRIKNESYAGTWANREDSSRHWTLSFDEASSDALLVRAGRLTRKALPKAAGVEPRGPLEAVYKVDKKRSHGRLRIKRRVRAVSRDDSAAAVHSINVKAPLPPPRPRSSWLTGDVHTHSTGCDAPALSPAALHAAQVAADIDVANALVWGDGWEVGRELFTGNDHRVSTPDNILHYDLEVSLLPAAQLGHLILLGLRSLAVAGPVPSSSHSGVPLVDQALAQDPRVLVGMAHGGFWPTDGSFPEVEFAVPFEFPVHVARGTADFLGAEEIPDDGYTLWESLLNSGFRVPLAGGSDTPCIPGMGRIRTFVETGGVHSFDAYLDGIRSGRTIAARDDAGWAAIFVDGRGLGDDVEVDAGEPLEVAVEADLPEATEIDLVFNGDVVETVALRGEPDRASARFVPDSSGWLIARTAGLTTSPIYVLVDRQPVRSADDACYLARYVGHLATLVATGVLEVRNDRAAVLAAYAEARDIFMDRFFEAGGDVCEKPE